MTALRRYLYLFLLLWFGELLSHANTADVMKTSSGSESEVLLPDGQMARLLFWVEGTRGRALQEKEGQEQEEHDKDEDTKRTRKKKQRNNKLKDEGEENHDDYDDDDEAALANRGDNSTISIVYFVSSFKYPSLIFTTAERNVWLSVHFHYNRVYVPAVGQSRNPAPPSWWGRRVIVSSVPPVYWYLCPSPDQCAPGNPPHLLHNANASLISKGDRGLEKTLVIALGTTSGLLLLLSLGLLALVLYLRRRLQHLLLHRSLSRTDTIPAHQFTTSF